MSEYLFIEKPLLDHLRALGWEVIEQGAHAIPSDPAASLRDDFREVTLRRVFCETMRDINLLPDGSHRLGFRVVASLSASGFCGYWSADFWGIGSGEGLRPFPRGSLFEGLNASKKMGQYV